MESERAEGKVQQGSVFFSLRAFDITICRGVGLKRE